jgi:hypothetical protein
VTVTALREPLDVLLTDAAVGQRSRFVRPLASARVAAGLARHPRRSARRAGGLGGDLLRVAAGRSNRGPAKGDRRFADPAWQGNRGFRALMQAYLSIGDAVDGLVTDSGVDWRAERQARFAAGNIVDALAPTNFAWSNPAVLKATIDQGGANLARGARTFVSDFPRLPAMVDTTKFAVGENLAATPGSVVLRTDVFELIHYAPQTEQVREIPLLFVPPTINKYYVLDLAPGRSMVEHMLAGGMQVFMISWRNPDEAHGHFDLDTYARAVLEARDAVSARAGSSPPGFSATWRRPAGWTASRASRCSCPRSTTSARGRRPRSRTASWRPPRSPNRRVAATSTARRSRACSRGCGRTISCGATWSTTTCWARRRRPSTSSTGTRTASGSRPACTATSCASRSRTR